MMIKTDFEIQKDVMDELSWLPFLHSEQIGVSVKKGVVTLTGQVDMYNKKLAAENSAKKIAEVKAVAENIQVVISTAFHKTDTKIADAVVNALKWQNAIQKETVKIKVEKLS